MTITKLHTSCPAAGFATFSDGKSYDWVISGYDGSIIFHTDRGPKGYRTSLSFRSTKRAAALIAALNA